MRRVDPLERERFKSRTSAKGGAWTLDLRAAAWLSLAMSRQLSRFLILLAALACSAAPALAKVGIRVDLGRQRITIVKNNEPPIVWKISSGRPGYETPTGRFIMQRMDADHFSDEYDQAPMPYAIFLSRGLAIHGSTQPGLGRPASHGCVRLSVDHARDGSNCARLWNRSFAAAEAARARSSRERRRSIRASMLARLA